MNIRAATIYCMLTYIDILNSVHLHNYIHLAQIYLNTQEADTEIWANISYILTCGRSHVLTKY